jgi:hypothetical protein
MLKSGVSMIDGSASDEPSPPGARALKSRLRSLFVDTPLRRLAAPIHCGLTAAELLGVRWADVVGGGATRLSADHGRRVTAIVKTFERPAQLERLLSSLRRFFPSLMVIVADDSRQPREHRGARTIALPFDVGVSAGRQAALAAVETEYTWVLDDDFVIYRGTTLARVLRTLDETPRIDILGGPVIDLPFLRKQAGAASAIYPTSANPVVPLGSRLAGLPVRDKVPNFFVARTERLRLVGWDSALKRVDHADFFTRARGVLVTTYDDEFRCLHAQTPFHRDYMQRRMDVAADEAILRRRYFQNSGPP